MNLSNYNELKENILQKAQTISDSKRPSYTQGNPDVLKNFKAVAERVGMTPLQVWGVYFNKHIDSINSFVKDEKIHQAEPMEERFCDALNYLMLGWALSKDDEEETNMASLYTSTPSMSTTEPFIGYEYKRSVPV